MKRYGRLAAVIMAGLMVFTMTGCSINQTPDSAQTAAGTEAAEAKDRAETAGVKEPAGSKDQTEAGTENRRGTDSKPAGEKTACLITSTARGNEYVDLIWSGFQDLEKEGWKVKCIECFEAAEQEEQVRAMCAEGYNLIYTNGDDIMFTIWDIQDELLEQYPETRFFFLDTYEETKMPNSCTVTIDPFESCFIAGYVAANMSQTGKIGLMLPVDSPILRRFEYGYYAGVDYADNGAEIIKAYTNDLYDTTKGYESTISLLAGNKEIDLVAQAAYISGYGVIAACGDKNVKCIGVDDWQGDIDPCVFWSAIKSMNVAVTKTAHMWANGEAIPSALEFNLKNGGRAYAEQDLKKLSPKLADQVVELTNDIISGKVDVFSGKYEQWRIINLDE